MIITNHVSNLFNYKYLESLIPNIKYLEICDLKTNGCSASQFFLLKIKTDDSLQRYVIKKMDVTKDWLSLRSNDIGREAIILSSPNVNPLWEIVDNPYVAVAYETNNYAVLMKDVSSSLENLNQMPINNLDHVTIPTLAKLHARFWEKIELSSESALMKIPNYIQLNGPFNTFTDTDQWIGLKIFRGWSTAKKMLPDRTYEWLTGFTTEFTDLWHDIPCTLLHGDYRPMNLGYSKENNKMILLDWAFSGFGPCSIDLFWYLISTSNLRNNNEKPIDEYKLYLKKELGQHITNKEWERFVDIGIICSCYQLLWEKALNYNKNESDWYWWKNKLEKTIEKY